MRGIKGPVGTAQDSIDLLGSHESHASLESAIAAELGFSRVLDSTGQVYPRSLDYEVVTTLVQLATAPSSLATSSHCKKAESVPPLRANFAASSIKRSR